MSKTIGQQLKDTREARNLTIAKVVQATRIRPHYIEAMEADNFDALPSPVQARGFLRIYADLLGFTIEELTAKARESEKLLTPLPDSIPPTPEAVIDQAATSNEIKEGISERRSAEITHPKSAKRNGIGRQSTRTKSVITNSLKSINKFLNTIKTRIRPTSKKSVSKSRSKRKTKPKQVLSKPESIEINAPKIEIGEEITRESAQAIPKAQAIYASIGDQLRQQREMLGLSLDEVEQQTHLRKHHLQALETGKINLLSSPVQARGLLNNYASFLNLDTDAILLQFAEGLQIQHKESHPRLNKKPQPAKPRFFLKLPPIIQRYISTDLLVGGGLILFLLIFAIWGTSQVINLHAAPTIQTTAPSISDILLSTPTTILESPSAITAIGTALITPAGSGTQVKSIPTTSRGLVQIILLALQRSELRVTVDGEIMFDGRVIPGTTYSFDGNQQIEILTGNGASLRVIYNQEDLGMLGSFGEVVNKIYTTTAIVNPTPTTAPTPTDTSTPLPTLKPTSTPR